MSLDSRIAIALMEKARRVFSFDDTFLSFPITPISFTESELNCIANGDFSDESFWDFAEIVNSIPDGSIWNPDGRFLWNIYTDLGDVKLASSTRTSQEEADYQKAVQFLHKIISDGLQEDSEAVKTYRTYKDNLYLALQNYNQQKSVADNSTDSNERKRWNEEIEPDLKAKVAEIKDLWVTYGYKNQVDEALRIEKDLGSKSPNQTWSSWMNLFMTEDFKTSAKSDRKCMPSGFSPTNALDSSWQNFVLTENEATNLIQQAPSELKSRLATDEVGLDIESLSCEYNSVIVTRPWLSTDLFKARFWKFYDDSKILCDGRIPPSGLYPAYVASLILMRNLTIKLKPDSPNNRKALAAIKTRGSLDLGIFRASLSSKEINAPKLVTLFDPNMVNIVVKTLIDIKKPAMTYEAPKGVLTDKNKPVLMHLPYAMAKKVAETTDGKKANAPINRISKLRVNAFLRRNVMKKADQNKVRDESLPSAPSSDRILIMAFICRRLQGPPTLHTTLQW
jgi:hypothetical protein